MNNPENHLLLAYSLCHATRVAAALITGGTDLSRISSIRRQAKEWIKTADTHIGALAPALALEMAEARNFIYRLAYNAPPFPDTADPQILTALDALIKGDMEVDQYLLYRLISKRIEDRSPIFLGRPARWACDRLDRWYRKAKNETQQAETINNELISQICETSILLESDLYDFEPRTQESFKLQLALHTLPSLEKGIEEANERNDLKKHSPSKFNIQNLKLLRSLQHLLFRSLPYLPEPDYERLKTRLESLLSDTIASDASSPQNHSLTA